VLDQQQASAALVAAVPIPVRGAARFLEELAGHLAAHPDALTSGSSLCPPVLPRLAEVLHAAGHPVVRPGCASCGKVRSDLRQLRPEGRLCAVCDARSRSATCARCGREGVRIAARRPEGRICYTCYHSDPEVLEPCAECGKSRAPAVRREDGQALCRSCSRDQHGQPICGTCYTAVLRSAAPCPRCDKVQPLIARDDHGTEVCGPCVGFAADYSCRQCGRAGNPHSRGRCASCVLAERVTALLTGPDGTVAPQLEPLAAALAAAPSPFPAIQWIKESPNTELLAQLVAEGHTLTHQLLDALPPSRNQRYIRQLLVHTGILEEHYEDLERIPGWLEHELADKPAAQANLARPFLHWFLLRRARQRAAVRRHPASADRDLRRRVSVALDFLAWLDQRGLALADLSQDHIEDWLAEATSQRHYLIRYFLKWTTSRRLTRELTVPSIPAQEPQDLLDDDDRWQLLQRCLTDDSMPTDVRAAGAITLLFGTSCERVCHLTPEHLKLGDKHARLVLGRHPVLLPPRLAELLQHLADQPQPRPQLSRADPGPRWLFPGIGPGKPTSTHGMTQKLGRHGIPVRTARNAALAALATDLPSPILADLTGMHRHTAIRWVLYARRDWAEYLAARAKEEADAEKVGRPSQASWTPRGRSKAPPEFSATHGDGYPLRGRVE